MNNNSSRRLRLIHIVCNFVIMFVVLSTQPLFAQVGDPTIATDHPKYAGEGAFQEIEDCVQFATQGASTEQEKAIAMYLWLLSHQWHLMSPQEWCGSRSLPDTAESSNQSLIIYDANRARFSYGYGLCGTVHAWNEPYWQALGMPARRRAFPGHVNSEVFYNDSWHAFDTDMAGLVFRRDGVVAGYDDIIADPSLADSGKPPLPHYPFAWPSDADVMRKGWQTVAKGGKWYRLYNSGYASHPPIVHLRRSETFTRWFDRDHYGGPDKRRFWHHQAGGPSRNWSFFTSDDPFHDAAKSNARNDVSYCNGEFVYTPDLSQQHDGDWEATPNVAIQDQSPKMHSSDGQHASVTFSHFSPYVICGDPVDDANPMTGEATDGLVIEAELSGDVHVGVSNDHGQSWHIVEVQGASRSARLDLTEYVKGRYGWHVRLIWEGTAGIDSLKFTTVTQVCHSIYPQLKPNGTRVTYRSASRAVVPVLPNFQLPDVRTPAFMHSDLRTSNNLDYQGPDSDDRRVYVTTDNKPGWVAFPIRTPQRLLEVRAAMNYQVRVPPPANCDYHIELSTDDGQTWKTITQAEIPEDNEFSSGWLAASADIAGDTQDALVRMSFYADGHRTGLINAQLYGVYAVPAPQAVVLEYGWHDGQQLLTHREVIPAGTVEHSFDVPTQSKVINKYVRLVAE